MSQYDLMLDFKVKVGLYDLYFMVHGIGSMSKGIQFSSFHQFVHPPMHPCFTATSISWSTDFAIYLEDSLMYENDSLGY